MHDEETAWNGFDDGNWKECPISDILYPDENHLDRLVELWMDEIR